VYDFNLLQTLVTITETHWRRNRWNMRGSGFCDYDEEGNGQKLPICVVIDSYKCLDSVALQEPKGAYIGFLLG
jgi:hypothetical protein